MNIRRGRARGIFLVLVVAVAASACTTYLDSRAESALRASLVRVVGPAAAYDVSVSGASVDGTRFDRVRVVGHRVARAGAPVLDRIELELRGVVVDRTDRRLVEAASANGELRIRAGDLATFLHASGWIVDAQVLFEAPDRIVVTGVPQIGGLAFPGSGGAEFRGRLIGEGSQLRLVVERLRLGTLQAPPIARVVLERAINPIVDTAAYPLPARFDAISVDGETLRIGASGSRVTAASTAP